MGIKFGDIISGNSEDFSRRLNDQVPALCRTLPRSMQTEAMMFLMQYFRIRVGEPLDFFKNYYPPAWSVLYWMMGAPHTAGSFTDRETDAALCCQAMAMLLHSLDDHLVDGGIPATHLALLIRSQAWSLMNESIDRFCEGLAGGSDIAPALIDSYYTGITRLETPQSLDGYCEVFRKQMATWVIMPVLAAMKAGGDGAFIADVRAAYESFGIAWRLLDDLQDLEADMADGTRSAVYVCLDDNGRRLWDSLTRNGGRRDTAAVEKILVAMRDAAVPGTIAGRIVKELGRAAECADRSGLGGLAEEFRTLAGPVAGWQC